MFPVPQEYLARGDGVGYQIVSVELKDSRRFDQAVVSEGCIVEVRDTNEFPVSPTEVAWVAVKHKFWNFRVLLLPTPGESEIPPDSIAPYNGRFYEGF